MTDKRWLIEDPHMQQRVRVKDRLRIAIAALKEIEASPHGHDCRWIVDEADRTRCYNCSCHREIAERALRMEDGDE